MELVSGPHGSRPFQFVAPGSDDASRRPELAVIEKPHGEGGGMPAASGESVEDGVLRSIFVEMEGLGIEFGGEGFYPIGIDPQSAGAECLACGQILEIELGQYRSEGHGRPPPTRSTLAHMHSI
jgi:hypothetical protein